MGLANIKEIPKHDDPEKSVFDFHHYNDHLAIVQGIKALNGQKLTAYAIHPVEDHEQFLVLHQAFHDDMAKALGIATTDLGTLDHKDEGARREWSHRNYTAHLAARQFLAGI